METKEMSKKSVEDYRAMTVMARRLFDSAMKDLKQNPAFAATKYEDHLDVLFSFLLEAANALVKDREEFVTYLDEIKDSKVLAEAGGVNTRATHDIQMAYDLVYTVMADMMQYKALEYKIRL